MVADLYICWAYFYDVADNFSQAESVFQKGKDARAEPFEALDHAHKQFGFSMSQRMLHKEDYRRDFLSTMEERRFALTSLHTQRSGGHNAVGSIRTGDAVRSHDPGRVDQHHRSGAGHSSSSNRKINVYVENQSQPKPIVTVGSKSVAQTIIDKVREKENQREPGPWSKAGAQQSTRMYTSACAPSFPILEDMDLETDEKLEPMPMTGAQNTYGKGIQLPRNFISKNEPLTPFPTSFFIEEPIVANSYPAYDKCMLFPKPEKSFSIEELAAYRWYKRVKQHNAFTDEQDLVWLNEPSVGIRLYPQFMSENDNVENEKWNTKRYLVEDSIQPGKCQFAFNINHTYPKNSDEEFTNEDRLYAKWLKGEMPSQQEVAEVSIANDSLDPMDETIPVQGRQSILRGAIRKSVVPGGRKSIFPGNCEDVRKSFAANPTKRLTVAETTEPSSDVDTLLKVSPFTLEGRKALFKSVSPANNEPKPGASNLAPSKTILSDPYKPQPFSFESDPKLLFNRSMKPIAEESTDVESMLSTGAPTKSVLFGSPLSDHSPATIASAAIMTGVTRKSVCPPYKRKIESAISEEVPAKETCLDENPVSGFVIFEDPVTNKDEGVFKTPPAPSESHHPRVPLAAKIIPPKEIEEPDQEEAAGYQPNDTCSTQQFMYFIKSQSVSTPKADRRNIARAPLESSPTAAEEVVLPPVAECAATISEISPPQPRQLSTIMELTESTTTQSSSSSERESDTMCKTMSRGKMWIIDLIISSLKYVFFQLVSSRIKPFKQSHNFPF